MLAVVEGADHCSEAEAGVQPGVMWVEVVQAWLVLACQPALAWLVNRWRGQQLHKKSMSVKW